MLDELLEDFKNVSIDATIFSDSEQSFLSELDQKHARIEADAKDILNSLPVFCDKHKSQRDSRTVETDGIFMVDSLIVEVESHISSNLDKYINSLINFFTNTYNIKRVDVESALKDRIETFDAQKFGKILLLELRAISFSQYGYDAFVNLIRLRMHHPSIKANKVTIGYVPLEFSYDGSLSWISYHTNERYGLILNAISLTERGSNAENFRASDLRFMTSYLDVLPSPDKRLEQNFIKPFDLKGVSTFIDSIRFFMNNRMDIKFCSESQAQEFYTKFIKEN
jgi:hypothetical protein